VTRTVATANYHWFFLATGNGIPQHVIAADPGYRVRALTGQLVGEGASPRPSVHSRSDPVTAAANDTQNWLNWLPAPWVPAQLEPAPNRRRHTSRQCTSEQLTRRSR
jgi:hypothetical protein